MPTNPQLAPHEALEDWLKARHAGFHSLLECRDVEGAGRGMFVSRDVQPGETVLELPASALLNPLTIRSSPLNTIPTHIFPLPTKNLRQGGAGVSSASGSGTSHRPRRSSTTIKASNTLPDPNPNSETDPSAPSPKRRRLSTPAPRHLNTTQLLTLHLLLSRDPLKRHVSEWEVYIRTLPDFEGWHPLTWLHGGLGIGKGEFSWHGEIDGGADGTKEDVEGRSGYASEKGKAETPLKGGTPRPQPPLHPSPSPSPRELKECLTHNAKKKLADVQERYETDKATILHVLRAEEPFRSQNMSKELCERDMLWAWLNVNTRSVSIPLGYPDPSRNSQHAHTQNHTLVPLLDMLNHSSDPDLTIDSPRQVPSVPASGPASSSTSSPTIKRPLAFAPSRNGRFSGQVKSPHLVPGRIGLVLAAPFRGLKKGDEVTFQYGSHCSATLFTEYGFSELRLPRVSVGLERGGDKLNGSGSGKKPNSANTDHRRAKSGSRSSSNSVAVSNANADLTTHSIVLDEALESGIGVSWKSLLHGQLDVGWIVDEVWEKEGHEEVVRETKEDALRVIGCHRNNIIHTSPSPPHPSHSLLMTLRLYHLPSPLDASKLRSIRSGAISYVSPQNEERVLLSLRDICETVISEAESAKVKVLRCIDSLDTGTGMSATERTGGDPGLIPKVNVKVKVKDKVKQGPEKKRKGAPGNDKVTGVDAEPEAKGERQGVSLKVQPSALLGVLALWQEEEAIARAILDRLNTGDTDW